MNYTMMMSFFYEGHSLGDALYGYCHFNGIKYEYEEREDDD